MSEFAPPTGPPPPKLPEGWKAVWNDQYSEWFFVNIYTKKSQWEKPNEPVYPPGEAPPDGPPPYQAPPGQEPRTSMDKKTLSSNNPYAGSGGGASPNPNISEDEALARRLQEEEDARARGDNRGAADAYYGQGGAPQPNQYGGYGQQNASPYPQSQNPYAPATQDKGKSKGGFLGKLLGKHGSSSGSHGYPQQQQGYPQPYGQPGYGTPGYGQPAGGYYGQQPGYYPQQQMYGRPPKKSGGLGAGGAAALGVGGGLLGGALLGEALADGGDGGDGGDFGGDGGDFGGDGGDFGGDMGGGDF